MFVCKECAEKTGWMYYINWAYGLCELCDRQCMCDDIKPMGQPAKQGSLDAIRKERDARRADRYAQLHEYGINVTKVTTFHDQ